MSYLAPRGFEGKFVYNSITVKSLRLNPGEEIVDFIPTGGAITSLCIASSQIIWVDVRYLQTLKISPSISGVAIEAGDGVSIPITVINKLDSYYRVELKCFSPQG